MAVPGHPAQPAADGTNSLLRDGAALVRGAPDVLSELGLLPPAAERVPADELIEALADEAGFEPLALASQLRSHVPGGPPRSEHLMALVRMD